MFEFEQTMNKHQWATAILGVVVLSILAWFGLDRWLTISGFILVVMAIFNAALNVAQHLETRISDVERLAQELILRDQRR